MTLEIDPRDRGGTRTRPLQDSGVADAGIQVECKTLAQVLAQENVQAIDALKIDVEGAEDAILLPFFKDGAGEPVAALPDHRGQPMSLARRSVCRIAGARL